MTEKAMRKFYGLADEENLTHEDPEEAAEDYWDCGNEEFPVRIYEFQPADLTPIIPNTARRILLRLLEELDEDFGNPDSDNRQEATEAMKKAAEDFVRTVWDEYDPWVCNSTGIMFEYAPGSEWEKIYKDTVDALEVKGVKVRRWSQSAMYTREEFLERVQEVKREIRKWGI